MSHFILLYVCRSLTALTGVDLCIDVASRCGAWTQSAKMCCRSCCSGSVCDRLDRRSFVLDVPPDRRQVMTCYDFQNDLNI